MSLPFARSERSLYTDDYRTALICGLIVVPFFVAWLLWFFAGDLPVRQSSRALALSGYDTVVANFALAAAPDLHPGDVAQIRLQLPGDDHLTTIPALVTDIQPRADQSYDVYLAPAAEYLSILKLPTLTGEAAVDVDDRSPFQTLLQAE